MKQRTGFLWISLCIVILLATACGSGPKFQTDAFKSNAGGFEYKVPVDYQNMEDSGAATILAPGADADTGPIYIMVGSTATDIATNEDFLQRTEESFAFDTYSTAKDVKVDGKNGLQIDFTVDSDGTMIEGSIVVVVVSPTQQFIMLGGGSTENWKDQPKVYNAIVKNIKFFEPIPSPE